MLITIMKMINVFLHDNRNKKVLPFGKRSKKGGMHPRLKALIRNLLINLSGEIFCNHFFVVN